MSSEQQEIGHVRPRATTWGGASDRAVLQRIAGDVALRHGFRVCAIEVLRNDGMLEFVAIHGSPEGATKLMGQGSPVGAMAPALACGSVYGSLTFVPAERLTEEAFVQMTAYGHVPQLADSEDLDAWSSEDMLVAKLCGVDGALRGMLYLDEPLSGRRLRPEELHTLSDDLELTFAAIVTAVEREAFAHKYQLAHVAREVIRAASNQLGLDQLLAVARTQLTAGFQAAHVHLHVFGRPGVPARSEPSAPSWTPAAEVALEAVAGQAGAAGGVAIVERDHVWGIESPDQHHVDVLTDTVATYRLSSVVIVPVMGSGRLLGVLVIVRGVDDTRWSDTESAAAFEVGQDLGRAILDARAFDREQELNAELRRLDAFRTELIATVAHEMKNPIGVVLGHLEMLEDHPALEPEIASSHSAMARAGARLESLADSLLTLSRVGNPDHLIIRQPVDLAALVAETRELSTVVAAQAGVSIEVEVATEETCVLGDPDDLGHVVTNLLSNAVKYSEPRTTVRVRLERRADEVVLSVADEGLGISEADQSRLFSEFFRSTNPQARTRPGTGLGLAIVRRVVVRHGGRIEVESTLGVGTTFRVSLPAG